MEGFLLCSIYLSLVGLTLCQSDEPMSCHDCRSDKTSECADDFKGRDNRFLQVCDNSNENITVTCRKEINRMKANKEALIIRSCYYTEGFKPEEEFEAYGVTYWTCYKHGCNGQPSTRSTIPFLGCIIMAVLYLQKNIS